MQAGHQAPTIRPRNRTAGPAGNRAAGPAGHRDGRPQPTRGGAPTRQRGEDIMQIIRQLSDLLTRENTALKRHRIDEVKAMTDQKDQLARLYQQQMNVIHRNPALLKEMESSKRNALVQAANRLTELMGENASLLKGNIRAINTYLKTVVEAVREKQERKSTSYSKAGYLDGYATVKRNLAVSFNEVT